MKTLLVEEYIARIRYALRDLPPDRRDPLVADIREHVRLAREGMDREGEAQIRQLLDDLGDPNLIRAEAGLPPVPVPKWGDRWAPWLLLFGGFVFGVGWVFGVILLWQSSLWRTSDKILGTMVWTGGLWSVTAFGLAFFGLSTGEHIPVIIAILAVVLAIAGPILVAIRLFHVLHPAAQGMAV